MKKLLFILALTLGITGSTFAQDKKVSDNRDAAIKDINQFVTTLSLDSGLKESLVQIYDMRVNAVRNATSAEEKKAINEAFNFKILAALSDDQRKTLDKNKALKDKIIINLE